MKHSDAHTVPFWKCSGSVYKQGPTDGRIHGQHHDLSPLPSFCAQACYVKLRPQSDALNSCTSPLRMTWPGKPSPKNALLNGRASASHGPIGGRNTTILDIEHMHVRKYARQVLR